MIENWVVWFGLAVTAVILEIVSGTFYLLMLAIGLSAGGLTALAGGNLGWQFLIAAVTAMVATILLRRSRYGREAREDSSRDPNVNLDIGQRIDVAEWKDSAGRHMARAMYRGALWDVELAPGEAAQPGSFYIREVRGSVLLVSSQASQ
jgi:membrane protein implicated in regulation of membrane protease activity